MKENVLESNDNDMSYINLNESSTGASLLNTKQKSTYAEVVKSFSGLGKSWSNIANSAVKATGKENNQAKLDKVLRCNSSDGFFVIKRKRRKFKQFFLSGIADDVNESQVISYLAKRNIIPNNIFIFRSQRRGTVSAKICIPVILASVVLEENVWPKYVRCKPWQHKVDKKKPTVQETIKTQAGITQHMFNGKYNSSTNFISSDLS
jgi:hypothetical protein